MVFFFNRTVQVLQGQNGRHNTNSLSRKSLTPSFFTSRAIPWYTNNATDIKCLQSHLALSTVQWCPWVMIRTRLFYSISSDFFLAIYKFVLAAVREVDRGRFWVKRGNLRLPPHPPTILLFPSLRISMNANLWIKIITKSCLAHHLWTASYTDLCARGIGFFIFSAQLAHYFSEYHNYC